MLYINKGKLNTRNIPRKLTKGSILSSFFFLLIVFIYLSFARQKIVISGQSQVSYSTFKPNCERTLCYHAYVVSIYPHNKDSFTQGLVSLEPDIYYESSGLYHKSSLRKVELNSGEVLQDKKLSAEYFAEGLTFFDNKFYLLTWNEHKVLVYNRNLELLKTLHNPGYGWGITHDNKSLIVSDGSYHLYFRDPSSFDEQRRIIVHDHNDAIYNLNELEWIDGVIYANVFGLNYIAMIRPENGEIIAWLDLSLLYKSLSITDKNLVLNGIASIPNSNHILITGKMWPKMFEITLIPDAK